ncbi:(-)-germacrene D synthase-like [Mangifera indica]|uniref:(-)-germacrene D synthase-like n=1 Tax=Mangifera indica TaxID=29780 RepID=UPI001CFB7C01|nr:(-)-germacrene D synthase-like [Mangifera indica]
MSLQPSAVPSSVENNAKQETKRRSADYHPSIWGHHFLSYASDSVDTDDNAELLKLKEEIISMLRDDANKPEQKLELVNAIQRLGVSYHFESEIREIIEEVYKAHNETDLGDGTDELYSISLRFRLLRQHGYKIPCDVFNKFKDNNGSFKASLTEDVRGMFSFYEASHLRIHGETILDEALAFTTNQLESWVATQPSSHLAGQIKHALTRPLRKSLPRLEARYYMNIYHEEASHNEVILTFAKLDFNILQKLHQKELSVITKWWKDLNFAQKLPFARDRIVECYFWILGVYFEPEYLKGRRLLTKVISITSIIDDIYDVYGTIDELELLTSAIERWDMSVIDQLPDYMKLCYKALLDIYNEIESEMTNQKKLYRLDFAKEAMKSIVRNYHTEAKWCHENYFPTLDEYMSVALVTSAYQLLPTTSFVEMGDVATKEAFEWLFSYPKVLKAASIICRLMDDIVGHKHEQKRGHVASAIECHMKEHGVSEEETIKVFREQIANAWKDINEAFLKPTAAPVPLLDRILNFSRVIDLLYKDNDSYTNSYLTKDHVASLLRDPVQL